MKALEAAAIQALHSGRPSSLCSLLPQILGLQQFRSGTDKYPRGSWCWHQLPPHLHAPPANKQIYYYIHTHARAGDTDTHTGQAGKGEEPHKENPTIQRHILEVCPAPSSTRSLPASATPGIRVSVGKGRLGCSPAAPRPGIQLDVAVMGLSSSRSRLELPGWRLL